MIGTQPGRQNYDEGRQKHNYNYYTTTTTTTTTSTTTTTTIDDLRLILFVYASLWG